ncbi:MULTISPECIES: THUMP-like domain-containing protein [Flavobacterium]|uniref:Class I SAM-dependent methyltransferase n=1 Tax=Flavobacterium ranwuense TaxID=2541725 RepID=A0ABY2DPQ0_9FLAO|nr:MULTISPECIES: class I SAM-dependent methyltransferase [Flavobacterium]TDE28292.1 class I SAM-dependent methyltransferase [Flavobacterium ranwuense]TDE52620.1 class I SAM-dependent methyltransferase [Flavobacterium sp. GT3P67]
MDIRILNVEIQTFINDNISKSISKLALQKNPFPDVDWISILNQIEAKTKAKDKLPNWFSTKNIIYPSKISIEQTSSEKTAAYKASIVNGESLIDLTGGFGVDDYYFAKKIKTVAHCEINPELSNLVKHNFKQLNVSNITCYTGDSLATLSSLNLKWDWIYIDPSRRNDDKGKVFMLKDCLPNVPENLDFYFTNSNAVLIKTAPLLDISAGLSELKHVKTIHIVALENEVKELLWELHKDYFGNINIKTVNIVKDQTETFDFILGEDSQFPNFSLPQRYLYEPNSAIMKSGGFDEVSSFYNLNKLQKHSHLYTSTALISFPGRIFEIQKTFPYNKTEMKSHLEKTQANITTRNFPDSVETIRKKWKIKDGGNAYCFFTTDENNHKIVLICTKIS